MRRISIKILAILLIMIMISPFGIIANKSFATNENYTTYTTTIEDEDTPEKFKSKYNGKYNFRDIEDVKVVKTEYKYTYQLENHVTVHNNCFYGTYDSLSEAERKSPKKGDKVNQNQLTYIVLSTSIEAKKERPITKTFGPYKSKEIADKAIYQELANGGGIYDKNATEVYLDNTTGWWIKLYAYTRTTYNVYFTGQLGEKTVKNETSDWITQSFSSYVQSLPSDKRNMVTKVVSTQKRVTYGITFKSGSFGNKKENGESTESESGNNKEDTGSNGESGNNKENTGSSGESGNNKENTGSSGESGNNKENTGSSSESGNNEGTGNNTNSSEDSKIYTDNLTVGDILKFTAKSWYLRNEEYKTIDKFLYNGNTFEILAIDGNYLKIKIISGENQGQETYIKYGQEAVSNGYFVKVDAISVGDTDESSQKNTNTLDGATKNLLYNIYSEYYNIVADNKQDTNAEAIRGMINDYATEIESGKSTVCDIVEKMIPEDKLNLNISDEEFANRLYKAFTLVEKTTDDKYYSLVVEQASKSRSEALGLFLVTEIPDRNVNFYALCKKYGIEDKIVIGRPNNSSQTTTNTNKSEIESFIKSIIEKANVKISDEDKNKLIDNLASGKISGATAVKTVIESDEFKNLKLTDSNYIKVISKICLGEDISDTDLQTYEKKLIDGTTRNELLKEFILNSKFQTICDNLKITRGDYTASPIKSTGALAEEFVKNVYTSLTEKDASNIGSFSSIVNGTQTATEVIQAYVNSTAFKNRKLSDEEYVKALFKAALNRAPSQDEINTYTSKIKNSSQIAVIDDIVKTNEFKKRCNQYYLTAGKYEEYVTDSEKEQVQKEGNVQIIRKEKTTKDGKKVIYLEDVVFDLSGKTKGDVNGDKNVSVEDAVYVLTKAVALTLNDKSLTQDELTYVDIDSDEMITVQDAQYILTYYARKSAALNPTWEEVVSGNYSNQNNQDNQELSDTSYKRNIVEEIKKTGIQGIYKYGNKQYTVYSQGYNDIWGNKEYSMGTYATDACGITTIATILTGFGVNKTPEGINDDGIITIENLKTQLKTQFNKYGVSCSDIDYSKYKVVENLKKGNPVFVHVSNNSKIGNNTYRGHYVALLGIDEDEKIFLADPAGGGVAGGQNTGYYEQDKILPGIDWCVYISNNDEANSNYDSSSNKTTSNFLESAKIIKEKVANNGYKYGDKDPRNTNQINCTTYITWSLLNMGYDATYGQMDVNEQDKNKLIHSAKILKQYCDKNNFKQVYAGKTLNAEETNLEPGDIVFEGSDASEDRIVHVQVYAGKNSNEENIWYQCGSDTGINMKPGTDTKANPYAEDHYIVYVYRVPNKK